MHTCVKSENWQIEKAVCSLLAPGLGLGKPLLLLNSLLDDLRGVDAGDGVHLSLDVLRVREVDGGVHTEDFDAGNLCGLKYMI